MFSDACSHAGLGNLLNIGLSFYDWFKCLMLFEKSFIWKLTFFFFLKKGKLYETIKSSAFPHPSFQCWGYILSGIFCTHTHPHTHTHIHICIHSEVVLLSCVRLFAIPWTVAYQAPPSMEFSRQEYWSGLPFPSPGDLPDPGIEPRSPTLQADTLPSELPGKHIYIKPRPYWASLVA